MDGFDGWVAGWVGKWMNGLMDVSKNRFKDCLQQSKIAKARKKVSVH